jgi:hypothetical protein
LDNISRLPLFRSEHQQTLPQHNLNRTNEVEANT